MRGLHSASRFSTWNPHFLEYWGCQSAISTGICLWSRFEDNGRGLDFGADVDEGRERGDRRPQRGTASTNRYELGERTGRRPRGLCHPWLAVCSDVRVLFRGVDVDGVDGVDDVEDVAAKRPRGPPRTSRSLAELDASEGFNFRRFCSPATLKTARWPHFGDDARAGARSRGRGHSPAKRAARAAAEERTRGCAAFRNHSDYIGEGRSVALALTKGVRARFSGASVATH